MGVDPRVFAKINATTESLQRNVSVHQRKTKIRITSLEEINANDLRKVDLLYHNSGCINGDRFLIFTTIAMLAWLSGCTVICADATFKVIDNKPFILFVSQNLHIMFHVNKKV